MHQDIFSSDSEQNELIDGFTYSLIHFIIRITNAITNLHTKTNITDNTIAYYSFTDKLFYNPFVAR